MQLLSVTELPAVASVFPHASVPLYDIIILLLWEAVPVAYYYCITIQFLGVLPCLHRQQLIGNCWQLSNTQGRIANIRSIGDSCNANNLWASADNLVALTKGHSL